MFVCAHTLTHDIHFTQALTSLITKPTPGLSQALTAYGLSKTPLAALSRLVSGIRQVPSSSGEPLHGCPGSLIVALPGSQKAVKECLDVLVGTDDRPGVIMHALHLCAGGPDSGTSVEAVHKDLHGGRDGTSTDTGAARTTANNGHQHQHAPAEQPQPVAAPAPAVAASGWDDTPGDEQESPKEQPQPQSAQPSAPQSAPQPAANTVQDPQEPRDTSAPAQGHSNGDTNAHDHSHGHTHGHSHGHAHVHSHAAPKPRTADPSFLTHSPRGPNTARSRQSPYPILALDEALALIDEHTPKATRRVVLPVDENLVGYVLAQDVKASLDLPVGNTTNVDGYAVSVKNTPPGDYAVVTASELAQRQPDDDDKTGTVIQPGEVCRVNTGQALPAGTDGVVMVEDTRLLSTSTDASGQEQESRIEILAQIDPLENVRKRGSDVRAGQIVLTAGTLISALGGEIGTLAFLGVEKVSVYQKPKVAILSTGDELRELHNNSGEKHQHQRREAWGFKVYDANRPGLKAAVRGQGLDVIDLGILGDDTDRLVQVLKKGLEDADVILTTGGTSMGESDLLKPIIERELNGTIHFGRVSMKPGKPTTFATIAAGHNNTNPNTKTIFALPGNPASALVTFYLFVLPCLRKMAGHLPRGGGGGGGSGPNAYTLPRIQVHLSTSMKLDSARPEFHRVVIGPHTDGSGKLIASSTGSQRSSGMHSMSTANGLVCLPVATGEKKVIQAGHACEAILLGGL